MSANQPLEDAIVIGIDFGTTFSGVAWAYSKQPDEIEIVTSWDAELHHCSDVEKAPTQLYFDDNGQDVKWGHSIPIDKEPLKWFKLFLIDPKDLPTDVDRSSQLQGARHLRNKINKTSLEIIATFLRKLWHHSMDSIRRSIGADLLKKTKLQVVITLPAALATIIDLAKRSTIQTGDTIVVCDAGGGTVDLVSYIFIDTDPFVVKECVKGDGDLCGGVFLDESFIKLVKKKSPLGTWVSVSDSDEKKFLNDQWEHGIKPQFDNQKRVWPVDLPKSCGNNFSIGLTGGITIELTSDEILSVFSPVIDKIENLVNRQVDSIQRKYNKAPKYIILVGGFGRSRYLFNSLKKRFQSTILQSRGKRPWTAICRGAVVQGLLQHNPSSGLGINVETRIARMSYGVRFSSPFIEGTHDNRDKVWDDQHQVFVTNKQMCWFLEEGEDVSHKRSVDRDYYCLVPSSVVYRTHMIYSSTTFSPPSRYDTANVRLLCSIKWNKVISPETLPQYTNPVGQVFPRLVYNIKMDCEDGTVNFTIHHNGSKVGEQNVEVQFN